MKLYKIFFLLVLVAFASCSSLEDNDHYGKSATDILNDELKIVNMSTQDYIASRADLSDMSNLFQSEGIYDNLAAKGQLATVLVVKNDNFTQPEGDADDVLYVTKSHVSDISMSPSNLHNGGRIMMWHGKYVNISIDSLGLEGNIVDHIKFNNAAVEEVIKTNNGYVYVISDMIKTPTSLYDYINALPEEYSIFREMVLASGKKVFDRANSKPVGVNAQGGTIYDSVFVYTNEYFDSKGFDMTSESLTATMLLFSNDVINAALSDAHARMQKWGLARGSLVYRRKVEKVSNTPYWRDYIPVADFDEIMKKWILDVAFFRTRYTADQVQNEEGNYLSSISSKQWKTDAQKIDKDNVVELSNAVVYNVTKLHLPNNVLIYRLKNFFSCYENCTDVQKEQYFVMTNATFKTVKTDVAAWSPQPGVWPNVSNTCLHLQPGDAGNTAEMGLDFTLLSTSTNSDDVIVASPYMIPPGKYRLAMGFAQNLGMDFTVEVFANNQKIATSDVFTVGSATTYHYDRGATLGSSAYPEGYDINNLTDKKKGNYDTDGGPVISELTIPDLNGDNSSVTIMLRIHSNTWNGKSDLTLHHWCLRPTSDNY